MINNADVRIMFGAATLRAEFALNRAYRLLVPKPLVLVSTVDNGGVPNVSTAAYVTFVSSNPPTLALSLGNRRSLKNIKATGEFVINVPDYSLAEESWITGELFANKRIPRSINKFQLAGLTPLLALKVKAPLVKECFASIECNVLWIRQVGSANLVIGEVLAASGESEKFDQDLVVRPEHLRSLQQVSGAICTRPGEVFAIDTKHAEAQAKERIAAISKK